MIFSNAFEFSPVQFFLWYLEFLFFLDKYSPIFNKKEMKKKYIFFSSPELKAQVRFSDHLSSVVCPSVRLSVCLSVRL